MLIAEFINLVELPVAAVFDVYDNEILKAYPLVRLNVDVGSTTHGEPLLVGIVVVVKEPVPVFKTQLGN
jgi:hypothetical protein